jgi:hypothetical protein
MDLILALAKGLLSSLGASIFNSVFPPGVPSYFAQILEDIENLIHIEAVSNDITLIKGTVDGVISQMTIDYANKKASPGVTNQQLIDFLAPIEATLLDDVMGPLEALTDSTNAKGNAQQSLLVYLLGGGMQFAVLQEMALHDPASSDPAASQYALNIKSYAVKYTARAQNLLASLRTSRINSITGLNPDMDLIAQIRQMQRPGQSSDSWPSGSHYVEAYIYDNWLGSKECDNSENVSIWTPVQQSDAWAATVACRPVYIASAGTQFDSDWQKASDTISGWVTLQTSPLPGK